ncbi:hypothetical protein GE09DRAFT_1215156 [Coniochaeta sp. 2T2.1]|nr:hypothetical protein GE09DRAFT_1215156 [Coniochaeta sp. 2T2.1]
MAYVLPRDRITSDPYWLVGVPLKGLSLQDALYNTNTAPRRFNLALRIAKPLGQLYRAIFESAMKTMWRDSRESPTWGRVAFTPSEAVVLAPAFMACRPPVWLWRKHEKYSHMGRWAEWDNYSCPPGPDSSNWPSVEAEKGFEQVKKEFDEAAGELYIKYAYDPRYRFARRLGWSAVMPFKDNEYTPYECYKNDDDLHRSYAFEDRQEMKSILAMWKYGGLENMYRLQTRSGCAKLN